MKKLFAVFVMTGALLLAAGSSPEPGYLASKKSSIFHRPTCTWAKKISQENLVTFATKEEAMQKGYRPCKVCQP